MIPVSRPCGRVDRCGAEMMWIGGGWYDPERNGSDTLRRAGARARLGLAVDHAWGCA